MAQKRGAAAKQERKTRTTREPTQRRRAARETGKRKNVAMRPKGKLAKTAAGPAITLVNIIPRSLSAETNQDSEPHLSINPSNPSQIVATAFTPDPTGSNNAPIFMSSDGGATWALNSIVPSAINGATQDITTAFSGAGPRLHAGILRIPTGKLELMFTQNFAASGTMNIVLSQAASPGADQPFAIATTASPPNQARERIYVGVNDFATANGRTATIQQSIGPAANPSYRPARLERRSTSGQNGPQIRPAAHRDGTVYAAFYRWRSTSGNPQAGTFVVTSADVIVVRDDAGGAGANPFAGLTDPSDHLPGRRVAQGVSFQWMLNGTNATGQQRLGGCLSMAVDPRNSATAYLVYADRPQGSIHSLHLLRTIDRGQTWSHDLLRVDNATNGAVAVNSAGTIGFLYQQFQPSSGNPRWKTIFSFSQNGTNWSNIVLADCPATLPAKSFDPYIGDYDHLVAVDTQFAGVFSASNIPDHANFPSGVVFQRNADFNNKRLLRLDNTTVVRPSIDPYFFRVAL